MPLVPAILAIGSRRGPRRRRPAKRHADTGDDDDLRTWLRQRRIIPRIARRGIETSERLGRHRGVIERSLAWLTGYRRLNDSDLTGADREAQETSMLALHLLQSALVYVNTLLLQRILADRPIELTADDRRAITPLFWSHVRPYGAFRLDLGRHLDLDPRPEAA